jgi:hypothetical protein
MTRNQRSERQITRKKEDKQRAATYIKLYKEQGQRERKKWREEEEKEEETKTIEKNWRERGNSGNKVREGNGNKISSSVENKAA